MTLASGFEPDGAIAAAAEIAVGSSLKLKEGETVLIVTNPAREVLEIAAAMYDASVAAGAKPVLVAQGVKTQTDYAEEAVIAAFESRPDVFISLSAEKLGKDREGLRTPYEWDGVRVPPRIPLPAQRLQDNAGLLVARPHADHVREDCAHRLRRPQGPLQGRVGRPRRRPLRTRHQPGRHGRPRRDKGTRSQ